MFHYWIPKGTGFLGLGYFLVSWAFNHPSKRDIQLKKSEIEARGGGMWTIKDGKRVQVKD